eukprot:3501841-Rhodomonas_salina.2
MAWRSDAGQRWARSLTVLIDHVDTCAAPDTISSSSSPETKQMHKRIVARCAVWLDVSSRPGWLVLWAQVRRCVLKLTVGHAHLGRRRGEHSTHTGAESAPR